MLRWPIKDPNATLDYQIDWSKLLTSEILATVTWTLTSGLVLNSQANSATTATVWLSGGDVGQNAKITCRIMTTSGRTDERSVILPIRDR